MTGDKRLKTCAVLFEIAAIYGIVVYALNDGLAYDWKHMVNVKSWAEWIYYALMILPKWWILVMNIISAACFLTYCYKGRGIKLLQWSFVVNAAGAACIFLAVFVGSLIMIGWGASSAMLFALLGVMIILGPLLLVYILILKYNLWLLRYCKALRHDPETPPLPLGILIMNIVLIFVFFFLGFLLGLQSIWNSVDSIIRAIGMLALVLYQVKENAGYIRNGTTT